MKEIIGEISSYNLFNYLFPGIIFSVIVENSTSFVLLPDKNNTILVAFICYFIGMIISRVGSIIIEPVLKKMHFLKIKTFNEFIEASQKDNKLEVLSEQNNTYRTITSMILIISLTKLYEWLISSYPIFKKFNLHIILGVLFLLFIFSYKKQTLYIYKRIEKVLDKSK